MGRYVVNAVIVIEADNDDDFTEELVNYDWNGNHEITHITYPKEGE